MYSIIKISLRHTKGVVPRIDAPRGGLLFLKGALMGMCDIIPGVSGGTIALITGIYERLVSAIGSISAVPLTALLRGRREEAAAAVDRIDPVFLGILLAGIGIGLLAMSRIVLSVLQTSPAETYAFFFGLIIASSVLISYRIEKADAAIAVLWVGFGLVVGYAIGGLDQAALGHSLPVLFVTGFIALCAMILPGISGAYITLLMNQYEFLLAAIASLDIVPLIVYMAGGTAGILSMSRALKILLRTYHTQALGFLTGLMLGSTRLVYDQIVNAGGTMSSTLAFGAAGVLLIALIELALRRFPP
jgi:putative membrane protein